MAATLPIEWSLSVMSWQGLFFWLAGFCIATAAIQNILAGEEGMKRCRKPEIMADAAHAILNRPAKACSGNFFIDDEVLAAEGVKDFDQYAVSPGTPLMPDFFVPAPGARTLVGRA